MMDNRRPTATWPLRVKTGNDGGAWFECKRCNGVAIEWEFADNGRTTNLQAIADQVEDHINQCPEATSHERG